MDPYLEGAAWEDFHGRYIAVLADALVPHLRPRYAVRTELRIYLEHPGGQSRRSVLPDLGVFRTTGSAPSAGATAVAGPPTVSLQLPVPEVQRERYLEIRNLSTGELATVIELLSPGNKRGGSEGRREFLGKRAAILSSPVHWVELDLLRGGERMPTVQPLPAADYYALVSRCEQRPAADVGSFGVRDRMPVIPIPLLAPDADVALDLQAAFDILYDRAGYDYMTDYRHGATPPLSPADAVWAREQLASHGLLV